MKIRDLADAFMLEICEGIIDNDTWPLYPRLPTDEADKYARKFIGERGIVELVFYDGYVLLLAYQFACVVDRKKHEYTDPNFTEKIIDFINEM